MDLERMFDDLFTTYSSLDPPPIKRKTGDLTKLDLKEIDPNLYKRNMVSTIDSSSTNQDLEQEEVYNPFSPQTDEPIFLSEQETTPINEQQNRVLKGPDTFEKAFRKALQINPNIAKYKDFLVKTAKRESGFNSYIQNQSGAPYYGYFQMGKNEIAMTTGMSVEQFRNNPVQQILGACKLYEMNLKTIKKIGIYNLGRSKGYSEDALVAGAWLGGPGGVKKYLLGKGNPSDSHWYGGKGGTSVGRRMNEFNK